MNTFSKAFLYSLLSLPILFFSHLKADNDIYQDQDNAIFTVDFRDKDKNLSEALSAGAYFINNNSIGFYGNIQSDSRFNTPEFTTDDLDITTRLDDVITDKYEETTVLNFGITYGLNELFALYGGVGIVNKIEGQVRQDPSKTLSSDGEFFLLFENDPHIKGNLNAGVLLHFGFVALNIGYQFHNESTYIGLGAAF